MALYQSLPEWSLLRRDGSPSTPFVTNGGRRLKKFLHMNISRIHARDGRLCRLARHHIVIRNVGDDSVDDPTCDFDIDWAGLRVYISDCLKERAGCVYTFQTASRRATVMIA